MKKLNKTVLHKLAGEKLSKPELKFVLGGSNDDDTIFGGTLPGVTITCDSSPGRCWRWVSDWYFIFDFGHCERSEDPNDYCGPV